MINQLIQARKSRGLTQIEVARLLGIRQCNVNRWEKGVRMPTAPVLMRWAGVLGYRWELTYWGSR